MDKSITHVTVFGIHMAHINRDRYVTEIIEQDRVTVVHDLIHVPMYFVCDRHSQIPGPARVVPFSRATKEGKHAPTM